MTSRVAESTKRRCFLEAIKDQNPYVSPEDVRSVLAVAYGDRRLMRRSIRSIEDLEDHLAVLDENLQKVRLEQLNIDDPQGVREEFILVVAREQLEQLKTDASVDDLALPEGITKSNQSDQTQVTSRSGAESQSEDSLGQRQHSETSSTSATPDRGSNSPTASALTGAQELVEMPSGDSFSPSNDKQVTGEQSLSAETSAEVDSESAESDPKPDLLVPSGEGEDLTWDDLEIDLPQVAESSNLGSLGEDVLAALHQWTPDDVDFVVSHLDGVRELVLEGNPDQIQVGTLTFLRLAFDRPDEVVRYLDTLIDDFVDISDSSFHRYAILIANRLVRERPEALVGHFDECMEILATDYESVKEVALDTVERFSREHREQITSEHLVDISKGLNDEPDNVRADAALTLARVAIDRATEVTPYVGALVEQTQLGDESAVTAMHALRRVTGTQPSAVVPYTEQLLSLYDSLDEMYQLWMDMLIPLVHETDEFGNHVGKFVELLGSSRDTREVAAQLLNVIAEKTPEVLVPHLTTLETYVNDDPAVAASIISIFARIALYNPSHTVQRLDRIVEQYGDEPRTDYAVVSAIRAVSRNSPQKIVPYVDDIAQELTIDPGDKEARMIRDEVAYTLGNVASVQPEAVRDYAPEGIRLALHADPEVGIAGSDVAKDVAAVDTAPIEPFVDDMVDALLDVEQYPSEHVEYIGGCFGECLEQVAMDSPGSIVPHVDELLTVPQEHQNEIGTKIINVVARIASREPDIVVVYLDELLEIMRFDHGPIVVGAAHAVGAVAEESPKEVADIVGDIAWLFDEEEEAAKLAPLNVYIALLPDHVDTVSDALEKVVDATGSPNTTVQRVALDTLERYARERPEDVIPYTEQVASHLGSRHSELNRDAALILRAIAATRPAAVRPHISDIKMLLTIDDQPEAVAAACASLEACARKYPDEVASATSLLLGIIDSDEVEPELQVAAFQPLQRIGLANPTHLSNKVSVLLKKLSSDDRKVRTKAAGVLSLVARDDSKAVLSHLDVIVDILREQNLDYTATALFRAIAVDQPSAVATYTDYVVEMIRDFPEKIGDRDDPIPELLVVMTCVASDDPDAMVDHLDVLKPHLQSEASVKRRATAVMVLGAVSQTRPKVVEPYLDRVAALLKHDLDNGIYAAVDVLYNVALDNRDAVSEYESLLKDLSSNDEDVQDHVEDTLALIRGEDVDMDDDEDETLPYEEIVYKPTESRAILSEDGGTDESESV